MNRIRVKISYDGTHFYGYQVQPSLRTVQGDIESVLEKMHKGTPIRITASGRTDTGVHARGQVVHFDTPLSIPPDRWKKALNTMLPDDIVVTDVSVVDSSFHTRFNVKKKEYRYRMLRTDDASPFLRNYTYHFPYPLEVEEMKRASRQLEGTHDFTAFCSAKTEVQDKIRTIYQIDIMETEDELIFRFVGNGFLYNMVRILVGTLIEVGQGKRTVEEMKHILASADRNEAGKTAPPHGLYLWEVSYD